MKFNVLGALEMVTDDGRSLELNTSKTGQVIALLLVRCRETVSSDTLLEELWGQRLPRSARTTLQTYVYHARQMFDRELPGQAGHEVLVTRPPGYAILADEELVDSKRFERLVREGKGLLDAGRPEDAMARLDEALAMWHGPAFSGMALGRVLSAHLTHLCEVRIRAINLRIEVLRRLGFYQELVPELSSLVAFHPLNEHFHAQLIEALYKTGRRADALRAYQQLRTVLDQELGVEPAPEIRRLQYEVLNHGRYDEDRPTRGVAPRDRFDVPWGLRAKAG
ncbi:AfsR/SARP family transcriptional regulator [Streptomyces albireticuli]|uniref:Transcriptional regulator n=1 Tax=Streptomyces albireticuli TaxID=1940 RepID=A0A2A2DFR9_9ACTN|nr:AfsR/SARP family transcriptional regulator [Streptomyces albireticuli]MCD9141272.1 AfsR/SARP family transcriptional regulator [Streptomyces albireticuli]MCD9160767.1 AfsR/SARP family transcriptional regulator [Streptomyces albireticuli]MCD9191176.1 AfsR/SARP family transcriptional regulator [Streptomyces albireticuli]PAU50374.1 transcriptional regulator [Streptomyces albireticuli]